VDEKVIQAGKFDMKTSAQERRVLLQTILTQSNDADDVSYILPTAHMLILQSSYRVLGGEVVHRLRVSVLRAFQK